MKKIEAIIRREKFAEVRDALHAIEVDFFSYWDVVGQGREKEEHIYRGTEYKTEFIQRRILKIIVNDDFKDKTIKAILESANTGEIGDGKIFVSSVEESYRIRNGEEGPESLRFKENIKAQKV